MIKIVPDKEGRLTQWDLNRKVIVTGYEGVAEVHFASPGDDHGAYVVKLVDGQAEIPNILLTMAGTINVYVYPADRTVFATALWVMAREKPDDYVYTETEVWRYEKFVEQLNGKEDTANRVTTVDDSSDDKHYPTAKAVYKAIPKSLKNPYSLTFTGAVTGSYDGSKPMTFNIPSGGSGTDISLGLTGAAVGDIIKVKAVDADGKPTEWEAAEMPSMDNWELLHDVTLTEEVKSYAHDFSEPMRKLRVIIDTLAADADTNYSPFGIKFKGATQGIYYPDITTIYPLAIPRKNAGRAVYAISTYYQGETPVCEIHTSFQSGSNSEYSAAKTFVYDSITDKYVNDMMLPQILSFWQSTYGTFAAGTRYRIWGVKA